MLGSSVPASGLLAIISIMLTPAILILASGSMVTSTIARMARITDRARVLMERAEARYAAGDLIEAERWRSWLQIYRRRSDFAERALVAFYIAIGLFIAASLAIAVDRVARDTVPWLPVALVILGVLFLLLGTSALIVETTLATGLLRDQLTELDAIVAAGVLGGEPKAAAWLK